MAEDKTKQLFLSLIYSFQMQGMMQLGKLANPMTNKSERELDGAQVTIDMLDMVKDKTRNNIGDDESRFLTQVIADLKLNYVEERDKEQKEKQTPDGNKVEGSKNESDLTSKKEESQKEVPPKEEDAKKAEGIKDSNKKESGKDKPEKQSVKKEPASDTEQTSKDEAGK